LLARVRQISRLAGTPDAPAGPPANQPEPDPLQALEARITHLEQLLEGLQDSVYPKSSRFGKRISELEAQVEPAAMSQALSEDAREPGL